MLICLNLFVQKSNNINAVTVHNVNSMEAHLSLVTPVYVDIE